MRALGELLAAGPGAFIGDAELAAEEQRERAVEGREVRGRVPPFLRAAKPDELARRIGEPRLLLAVQAWQWGHGNLLLCGPTRCGKTTAAAYLFRRLLGQAVASGEHWDLASSMRWFSAADLALSRRGHPLGQGDPPELIAACNARLLFLDDAGWDQDVTETCIVLNERYEREYPTVITTGKTRAELTAHYGAAVVGRLRETGGKMPAVVDCFPKGQSR
jgi:DNA polymerase III delta prime subunit